MSPGPPGPIERIALATHDGTDAHPPDIAKPGHAILLAISMTRLPAALDFLQETIEYILTSLDFVFPLFDDGASVVADLHGVLQFLIFISARDCSVA